MAYQTVKVKRNRAGKFDLELSQGVDGTIYQLWKRHFKAEIQRFKESASANITFRFKTVMTGVKLSVDKDSVTMQE